MPTGNSKSTTLLDCQSFYPPIAEGVGNDDITAEGRARIVSSLVLDAHLVDAVGHEVNLAKCSPACPPEYTGRFWDQVDGYAARPEAQLSEVLAGLPSVHPERYTPPPGAEAPPADPRRGAIVILREPHCRARPPADAMARALSAVVNEYPAAYVQFLSRFVSATFGAQMRTFLRGMATRMGALVTSTALRPYVNIVTWKMYALLTRRALPDASIDVVAERAEVVQEDADDEEARPIKNGPATRDCPGASLVACLEEHVATYELLASMCNGFGTTDAHAHLLLEYANLCGRDHCEDALLVDDAGRVEYDAVVCRVPMSFGVGKENGMLRVPEVERSLRAASDANPSCHPTVCANLKVEFDPAAGTHVPHFDVPFGRWMGHLDTGIEQLRDELRGGRSSTGISARPGSNLAEEAITDARGHRWGFGHASTALPTLAARDKRGAAVHSNYFTPYEIDAEARTRSVDVDRYAVSIGRCTNWGAALFNAQAWGFGEGGVATSAAPPAARGPVAVDNATTRFAYIGPGDIVRLPLTATLAPNKRDTAACDASGSLLFRHNRDDQLAYAPAGRPSYEALRGLDGCFAWHDDGRYCVPMHVVYQLTDREGEGSTATVASSVRLYPTTGAMADVADSDGFATVAVTATAVDRRATHCIGRVPNAIGSSNDAALELRMAHLVVGRAVGMHLAHFCFGDVCAQAQNSGRLPPPSAYLAHWRAESDAARGFAYKLARLLRLYTAETPDGTSLLHAAVGRCAHLAIDDGAAARAQLVDQFPDLLPLFVPRNYHGARRDSQLPPTASTETRETNRGYARQSFSAISQFFNVAEARNGRGVLRGSGTRVGTAWVALYAHAQQMGAVTVAPGRLAWPREYARLRGLFSGETRLFDDAGAPTYAPHRAATAPTTLNGSLDEGARAASPAGLFHVTRDADGVVTLQSHEDAG